MRPPRSERWGVPPLGLGICVACLALGVLAGAEYPVRAQSWLAVEVGFHDRFVVDRTARVRVEIRHEGPPLEGELVLWQTVKKPLAETRTVEVRRPVRLAPGGRPVYELYLPLSPLPPPEGSGPALHVELRSGSGAGSGDAGDAPIARVVVALDDRARFEPFVLLVGEGSYPRLLPTGERVEELRLEELPADWRAYDGVRRVYWGRAATARLLPEQKRALEKWLAAGGELAILGGENFLLQDDPWLRRLLPLDVEGVRRVEALNRLAVLGLPRGEVLYQVGEYPLVLRRNWGWGRVYFAAVDLRGASAWEVEGWKALRPPRAEAPSFDASDADLAVELFRDAEVLQPALSAYSGVLLVYVAGLGGLALWMLRRLRESIRALRWQKAASGPKKEGGGRALLLLLGWLFLCSGALVAYLGRPAFTRDAQLLEAGVLAGRGESGWAVHGAWDVIVHRRPRPLALPFDREALLYPTSPLSPSPSPDARVQLALQAAPDALEVLLRPRDEAGGGRTGGAVTGLFRRAVLPLDVRVELPGKPDPEGAGVRNPIARVYNGTPWTLRQAALQHRGAVHELGDLPPGAVREVDLSRTGKSAWVFFESGRAPWESRMKEQLYREALRRYLPEEPEWALFAWIEEAEPRESEYRRTYTLVLVASEAAAGKGGSSR